MKNKKIIITICSILLTVNYCKADYSFVDSSDFTGDAFFSPASVELNKDFENNKSSNNGRQKTILPLKKLKLLINNKLKHKNLKKYELAPTLPEESIYESNIEVSEFSSKEIEEDFSEQNTIAEEENLSKNKINKKNKKNLLKNNSTNETNENNENIILDCENIDYDTKNYLVIAKNNVVVEFVRQQTKIFADIITFDRLNNTIKAEGNVRIIKNNQNITGDYIFVDLNEENALIENPITTTSTIKMSAKKGYVYGDKIIQEQGRIDVNGTFPIEFSSQSRGPHLINMLTPKNQTLTNDMENGRIKINANNIKITQDGDLEIITLKKTKIKKGKHTILKVPSIKLYTNKNFDFVESNSWELGSYRGLGMFAGPGFVFKLHNDSVLKIAPLLNYNKEFGVGGLARYQNASNRTQVAYGTAQNKILVRGKQKLDDNLYIQYGVNDYMQEWFLGKRRPKYGIDLVYAKDYSQKDFLIKNKVSTFSHRFNVGYFHDIDSDTNFKNLSGKNIGTFKTRYMAQATQNLLKYKDEDKLKLFSFDINAQMSTALYGTGDAQIIGRIGPCMRTQYKRWMQDIGYFQSVYSDNSPIPVFDAYRYGKSNVYLREYLRINRYLTVSWFGSINLSGDSPNGKAFQENSFYLSLGPDDVKFHIGYDFVRENTFLTMELMMNAKGANIEYEKLEIKQEKKAKQRKEIKEEKTNYKNTEKPVLEYAKIENIKEFENVL